MNPLWSYRVLLPGSPIATSLAVLTWVLYRAWNTTGAPLFLAIVVITWTALIGDALWAFLSAGRPRLEVTTPSSALVGEPYCLKLDHARPRGALLKLHPDHGSGTVRLGTGAGPLASLDHRGLLLAHFGEVTVYGPLGLLACRRRFAIANRHRQAVGPVPDLSAGLPELGAANESETAATRPRGDDLTKSIRQYRRGDSRQHIAWKATARSGQLLVREFEGLADDEVTIVAEIRRVNDEASEAAMRRAAGCAINAIRAGFTVRLVTNHCGTTTAIMTRPQAFGKVSLRRAEGDARPLAGIVRSESDVVERLAAALPGKDLLRRVDGEAFYVSADGDRWET